VSIENNEKLQIPPEGRPRQEQLATEIAQLKQSVEKAKSQAAAAMARMESSRQAEKQELEREVRSRKRSSRILWAALLAVAAGLIATEWHDFPLLRSHSSPLAKLPGVEDSIGSLGKRIGATGEQLRSWASAQAQLGKRLTSVENRVTASLQRARRESRQVATEVRRQFQEEVNRRLEPIFSRMTKWESYQAAVQARLEQLRGEVSGLRTDTARELAALRNDNSGGYSDLKQQITSTQSNLDDLSKRMAFNRVDFEMVENSSRDLTPEVSLHVTKTDPTYQRVDGWLALFPEGPAPFHFLVCAMPSAQVWHQRGWLNATPLADPFPLLQDVHTGSPEISCLWNRHWS